jgi:alpha-mannosidase
MIGNAHLDPVWLWDKAAGVDAALATARSACDRLDEFPDFIFTCSASWFHEQAERLDPPLFARIRRHVADGRWALVGGMVIQPDCNLPLPESFARQLARGQAYYERALGRRTRVGYNVDSFGHTAYLPGMLRAAGIDSYIFMRPGPHEKALPSSLFEWRGPDGAGVTAFRIAGPYCTHAADLREHVETALAAMPDGAGHTMCFYGVGDHGGGPTREQIIWLAEHAADWPGVRLIFSHPQAFFDAAAAGAGALPVVEGELQYHAIGCYSVERRIKAAMRRAESRLVQAEETLAALPDAAAADDAAAVDRAWDAVLFNQFHDMLGGTCIDAASAAVAGELVAAEAAAGDVITAVTRRAFRAMARPGEHRIVCFNPEAEPFDGYLAHEPWGLTATCGLVDEDGRAVPCQEVPPRAKVAHVRRVLFRLTIPPRAARVLRVAPGTRRATGCADDACPGGAAPEGGPFAILAERGPIQAALRTHLANRHTGIEISDNAFLLGNWRMALEVCEDPSDTWSHSCEGRFACDPAGALAWPDGWETTECGPIRGAVRALGRFGDSRAWLRAMLTEDSPVLHLHLSVVWAEKQRLLRLRLAAPRTIERRTDLVSGGPLPRPVDGREYPLGGGLVVSGGGESMAVVAPEVFSAAVEAEAVNLTLLRSPYAAWHDPYPGENRPDHPVTDQGAHEIDVLLAPGAPHGLAEPARLARRMLRPPIVWDLTG